MILTATDLMLDDTGQPVPWHRERKHWRAAWTVSCRTSAWKPLTMEGECFLIPITDGRCWISATGR